MFGSSVDRAMRSLDANPKVWGWPIWSTKTGAGYVLVPEEKFRTLVGRAGLEVARER
jgi:hypothetical protein